MSSSSLSGVNVIFATKVAEEEEDDRSSHKTIQSVDYAGRKAVLISHRCHALCVCLSVLLSSPTSVGEARQAGRQAGSRAMSSDPISRGRQHLIPTYTPSIAILYFTTPRNIRLTPDGSRREGELGCIPNSSSSVRLNL
jgi:hypothetical protein